MFWQKYSTRSCYSLINYHANCSSFICITGYTSEKRPVYCPAYYCWYFSKLTWCKTIFNGSVCQVQISHNTDKKKTHDAELSSDSKTPHIYLKRWRQACLFYPEAAYLIWCYSIVKLTMHCFLCSSQWSWIFSAMFARLASCSPLPFRTRQSNVCPVYIRAFSQAKCKWSAKCFVILGLYTNLRITSICVGSSSAAYAC